MTPIFKHFTTRLRQRVWWRTGRQTLSQSKSTVVALDPRPLRAVRRELLEQGVSFTSANTVLDFGEARRGFCLSWPSGHAGTCVCPSSQTRKRALAAKSCGKKTKTVCTTTILHFPFGETGDPAIRCPLDQLRTWFELQRQDSEHRLSKIEVARAWVAAAGNMRKGSRWSMVKGLLTATMATLHDVNIIPAASWE